MKCKCRVLFAGVILLIAGQVQAVLFSSPSVYEQYMLELLNEVRADPVQAASELGFDLNEGLDPGTISPAPKQPLAPHGCITFASQFHSQWMLDTDIFRHYGIGNTSPGDRMAITGYGPSGSFGWAENIGWKGTTGTPDVEQYVYDLHVGLFEDFDVPGRGHRTNMLIDDMKEVGIGVRVGPFTDGLTYNTVMVTQDFGYKFDNPFITGVVYSDLDADDFYDIDEALGGLLIAAKDQTSGVLYWTRNFYSGGYGLQVPDGTYTVGAFGAALGSPILMNNIVVDGLNVKIDFTPGIAMANAIANPEPGTFAVFALGSLVLVRRRR